jgi:hypothetical protein
MDKESFSPEEKCCTALDSPHINHNKQVHIDSLGLYAVFEVIIHWTRIQVSKVHIFNSAWLRN